MSKEEDQITNSNNSPTLNHSNINTTADLNITKTPTSNSPEKTNLNGYYKKEKGKIVTMRNSYGFIRCLDRDEQLFFHFSKVNLSEKEPNLAPGDEIEFNVEKDRTSNRLYAVNVNRIPKGNVIFEELLKDEGRKIALVTKKMEQPRMDREPVNGQVMILNDDNKTKGETLSFSGRDLNQSHIKLIEGDEVEISIYINKRTKERGATQITLIKPDSTKREKGIITAILNNSYGFIKCVDRNETNLFFHFSERIDPNYVPYEDNGVEFNVIRDYKNQNCASRIVHIPAENVSFNKILPTIFTGIIKQCLKYSKSKYNYSGKYTGGLLAMNTTVGSKNVIEMLPYDMRDVINFTASNKLLPNDEVSFQISIYKPTGKKFATQIKLIKKAKQIIEKGIIVFVKQNEFGFIERLNCKKNLYFRCSECASELNKGDSVKFYVIKSSEDLLYAVNITLLPKNSVRFYIYDTTLHTGIVSKSINYKLRNLNSESTLGTIKISENENIPLMFNDEKINLKEIHYRASDFNDSKMDLRDGDKVSFMIKKDLRNCSELMYHSYNIAILELRENDPRDRGVVVGVRKDYGFLTSESFPKGIFFHFSSIIGDVKTVDCDEEFSFEISTDENNKKCAIRLIKLPKNSVISDTVDSEYQIGKIQNTGFSIYSKISSKNNNKGFLDYSVNDNILSLPFKLSDIKINHYIIARFDFVRFQIATEKATKRERATNIVIEPKVGKVKTINLEKNCGEIEDEVSHELFDFVLSEFYNTFLRKEEAKNENYKNLIQLNLKVGDSVLFKVTIDANFNWSPNNVHRRNAIVIGHKVEYDIEENGFYKGLIKIKNREILRNEEDKKEEGKDNVEEEGNGFITPDPYAFLDSIEEK